MCKYQILSFFPSTPCHLLLYHCHRRSHLRSSPTLTAPNSPLFSRRKSKSKSLSTLNPTSTKPLHLTLVKADKTVDSTSSATAGGKPSLSSTPSTSTLAIDNDQKVFVGDENVTLEGVIQFDKPDSSAHFKKWGCVACLASLLYEGDRRRT